MVSSVDHQRSNKLSVSCSRQQETGLTLIEVLVSIGIALLLVSISASVYGTARRRSDQATATSNMKQVSTGLILYSQSNEDTLPPVETARKLLSPDVTWDPADHWRKNKNEVHPSLLGSFGYIDIHRVPTYVDGKLTTPSRYYLKALRLQPSGCPLLISIFHSSEKVERFDGAEAPSLIDDKKYPYPKKVLVAFADTSIRMEETGMSRVTMSWSSLFTDFFLYDKDGNRWKMPQN